MTEPTLDYLELRDGVLYVEDAGTYVYLEIEHGCGYTGASQRLGLTEARKLHRWLSQWLDMHPDDTGEWE